MSIKQLYLLQCLEQDIAASEQELAQANAQIGESPSLKQARTNLAQASKALSVVKTEQKTTEDAIADLTAKMTIANESLYGGRIQNPKELQNLQRELASWQSQRDPLEEKSLALMEKAEQAAKTEQARCAELTVAGDSWQIEQATLHDKILLCKKSLEELKLKCADARSQVPTSELASYDQLKQTRGWAVAQLGQGACGHCRLSLSTATLQRARAGQTANCPNCGRLLFCD